MPATYLSEVVSESHVYYAKQWENPRVGAVVYDSTLNRMGKLMHVAGDCWTVNIGTKEDPIPRRILKTEIFRFPMDDAPRVTNWRVAAMDRADEVEIDTEEARTLEAEMARELGGVRDPRRGRTLRVDPPSPAPPPLSRPGARPADRYYTLNGEVRLGAHVFDHLGMVVGRIDHIQTSNNSYGIDCAVVALTAGGGVALSLSVILNWNDPAYFAPLPTPSTRPDPSAYPHLAMASPAIHSVNSSLRAKNFVRTPGEKKETNAQRLKEFREEERRKLAPPGFLMEHPFRRFSYKNLFSTLATYKEETAMLRAGARKVLDSIGKKDVALVEDPLATDPSMRIMEISVRPPERRQFFSGEITPEGGLRIHREEVNAMRESIETSRLAQLAMHERQEARRERHREIFRADIRASDNDPLPY